VSAFYDDLADTAADMLAEFGQAVTLTKAGTATYDPTTGTTSVTGGGSQTVSGCVFEYSSFIRSGQRSEPGSLIQAGDKQLLLAATATDGTALNAPKPTDVVTVGSVAYTITAVAPLDPAGTPVYYECNIRGAA
jgi:hypothetical protein